MRIDIGASRLVSPPTTRSLCLEVQRTFQKLYSSTVSSTGSSLLRPGCQGRAAHRRRGNGVPGGTGQPAGPERPGGEPGEASNVQPAEIAMPDDGSPPRSPPGRGCQQGSTLPRPSPGIRPAPSRPAARCVRETLGPGNHKVLVIFNDPHAWRAMRRCGCVSVPQAEGNLTRPSWSLQAHDHDFAKSASQREVSVPAQRRVLCSMILIMSWPVYRPR